MRLKDLKENDQQLDEFLPALGAIAGGVARVGASAVGAVGRGVAAAGQAAGRAVATGLQKGAQAVGQAAGLAGGGMDPAQAAQAKQQHDAQKKEIQDAIKAKQQEISDLQKQLSSLG